MTDQIVGRNTELAAVAEFLTSAPTGPGALVLEGEAGAGKTTIWSAATAAAAEQGFNVLASRPGRSETKLSFSALDDLLRPVIDEVGDALPEPQRRALDTVLLRGPQGGSGADARTVARAALETVRLLAAAGPVAVAVDDVQWLDRPSALVLEYVARRLTDEPVALVLASRTESAEPAALGLDRSPWPERVCRLPVGPLDASALHVVIERHVGTSLTRPVLTRVHQVSGGNPMYAVEIARALAGASMPPAADEPLPIPNTLTDLVHRRLARLTTTTREMLLVVASLARPTMRLVAAAVGSSAAAAVERAVRAGVLVVDRDHVEFTHPLLGSGVYAEASRTRRAAVHRRLAEIVADEEERARHLGLAIDEPDADVAAALDRAAGLALSRGAPSTAAELYEQAERLTPRSDDDGIRRRCLGAARCHAMSGDTARGRELAERVASTAPPGGARAEALLLLGGVDLRDDVPTALEVLGQALQDARGCPVLAAGALRDLSSVHLGRWDVEAAATCARESLAMAERGGDVTTLTGALVMRGRLDVIQGHPHGIEFVKRAVTMQAQIEHPRIASLPSGWVGTLLRWADDFDGARGQLEPLLRQADELGDESSAGELRYELSELERWAGTWVLARQYAQQSVEIHSLADRQWDLSAALAALAAVEVHQGRVDEGRANAMRGLAIGRAMGGADEMVKNLHVLGFLELSLSRSGPALDHLAEVAEISAGVGDPGVLRCAGDHIEALIGVGDLDAAEAAVERLDREAGTAAGLWPIAVATRCRGMLISARGDPDGALAVLDESLEHHAGVPMPFELARTTLVAGMVGRRARRGSEARRRLSDARSSFERMGAALWIAKVDSELARIGGRAPAPRELTVSERRIVDLVAAGRSNPEVAAELFMSRRTVEDHLSKIYRKLGVRSRTELAHRVASELNTPQP
jgi:DNA-binding CsgD family transcriptional regulator/tetratricopeptide (TPR) repeat protein